MPPEYVFFCLASFITFVGFYICSMLIKKTPAP